MTDPTAMTDPQTIVEGIEMQEDVRVPLAPGSCPPGQAASRLDASRFDPSREAMSDAELVEFAAEFREGVLDGRTSRSMCAMVCWPLEMLLNLHGVECWAEMGTNGAGNHVWIALADGRVLDPTSDQYNYPFFKQYPPVYLGPPTELHGRDSDGSGEASETRSGSTEGDSAGRRHRQGAAMTLRTHLEKESKK